MKETRTPKGEVDRKKIHPKAEVAEIGQRASAPHEAEVPVRSDVEDPPPVGKGMRRMVTIDAVRSAANDPTSVEKAMRAAGDHPPVGTGTRRMEAIDAVRSVATGPTNAEKVKMNELVPLYVPVDDLVPKDPPMVGNGAALVNAHLARGPQPEVMPAVNDPADERMTGAGHPGERASGMKGAPKLPGIVVPTPVGELERVPASRMNDAVNAAHGNRRGNELSIRSEPPPVDPHDPRRKARMTHAPPMTAQCG